MRTLEDHHRERLAQALDDATIEARGYWTATKRVELRDLGFQAYQTKVPALVIPIRDMDGQIVTYQIRPDEPRIADDGRPVKYETPGSTPPALDVPVGSRESLRGGRSTVWFTEGALKADAATSAGLCCVSVPGVWSWARRLNSESRTALPALFRIGWEGRRCVLCFDSDVMVKAGVHAALVAFSTFLTAQGAEVSYCYLPPGEFGAKTGLDDYLGAGHSTDDLWKLVQSELREFVPEQPRRAAWHTGVLLFYVERFITRYVRLPSEHETTALALFTLHTWGFGSAGATPYLYVRSPEKRSGKTRLLEALDLICRQPIMAASITEAGLFQAVEMYRPTLLLDEIDATFTAKSERAEALRGVLNAGNRPRSYVVRGSSEGMPQKFSTFCPKVLAGIDTGRLPDTIRDRSIVIDLERKLRSERVERLRERDLQEDLTDLAGRLDDWAAENADALAAYRIAPVPEISDRLEEAWEPLFAIAEIAGDAWPARARAAAVALASKTEDEATGDLGHLVLVALRDVFKIEDVLSTKAVCGKLNDLDDFPFGAFHNGAGINGRGLANLLRPYGITPKTIRVPYQGTPKGYRREWFEDAWRRYLDDENTRAPDPSKEAQHPPHRNIDPETTAQSQKAVADTDSLSATHPQHDFGSGASVSSDVADVADVAALSDPSARVPSQGEPITIYDALGEPDPARRKPKPKLAKRRKRLEIGLDVANRAQPKPWAGEVGGREAYSSAVADWTPYRPTPIEDDEDDDDWRQL